MKIPYSSFKVFVRDLFLSEREKKKVKPLIFDTPEGGLTIIESIWNSGNLLYFVANTYGLNVIKIGGIWIFWGGGKSLLLGGLHVTCDAHFQTQMSFSSQKPCVKIWFGLIEPSKSYHLNFPWGGGGRNPLLGRLHVTCDAHFRTWPSYFSQKSCVKIWFGLVEPFKSYRVHNHFSGGQKPPLGGVTFDLWCPFSNSDVLFQSKVMC